MCGFVLLERSDLDFMNPCIGVCRQSVDAGYPVLAINPISSVL